MDSATYFRHKSGVIQLVVQHELSSLDHLVKTLGNKVSQRSGLCRFL